MALLLLLHPLPLLGAAAPETEVPADEPARPEQVTFARLENGDLQLGEIRLNRRARELSFPATLLRLSSGVLEVLIATPVGRLHESLLRTDASPLHLQTMLFLLDLKNGPRKPDADGKQGAILDIDIEWQTEDGQTKREAVETWVRDTRRDAVMERVGWVFVGSPVYEGEFVAEITGNLVLLYSVGDTVLDFPDPAGDDDTVFIAAERKTHPGGGTDVRVILTPRQP